jgi:hypothetical protein
MPHSITPAKKAIAVHGSERRNLKSPLRCGATSTNAPPRSIAANALTP